MTVPNAQHHEGVALQEPVDWQARSQVLERALREIRQLAGLEGPPTSLSLAIYNMACAALGLPDEEGEGQPNV